MDIYEENPDHLHPENPDQPHSEDPDHLQSKDTNQLQAALLELAVLDLSMLQDLPQKVPGLPQELYDFTDRLLGLLTKINNSAAAVGSRQDLILSAFEERLNVIGKIAEANDDITSGMQKQVGSANVCARLADDLQGQFEKMQAYSTDLIAQANETAATSQAGGAAIEQLLDSSRESQLAFNEVSGKVMELAKTTENINGIIGSVIRIARQTNLLSINATIEAARAGLAGRGFEVVAVEFKKLALETQQAGEEISGMIAQIGSEIKSVLTLSANAQQTFQSQNQSIQNSSEALVGIRDSMNELMEKQSMMREIVESLFAQKKDLVDSIANIVEITDQSASISQMVSSISMEQNTKNSVILDMMKMQSADTQNLCEIMGEVHVQAQPQAKKRLGFVSLDNEEFFNEVEETAKAAGEKLGIEVLCKKPERLNVDEQVAIFKEFSESGVDGIIIVPSDENRLLEPINQAVAKGIRVACLDLDVPKSRRDFYMTSDSFEGGKLAGEAAARHLKGSGKVAVLICMASIPALQERYRGLAKALEKYPDIHIVSKVEQMDGDLGKARRSLEDMIRTDFDLLYLINSDVGEMAADLWKAKRLDKKLIVMSTSKKITEAVGAGIVSSQIVQRNTLWGEKAVMYLHRLWAGEPVDAYEDTGMYEINYSNKAVFEKFNSK